MDLHIQGLAGFLGISIPAAILVVLVLLTAKHAVMVAIKQAGEVEIERLRADAATKLEEFKSELGIAAETRRLVSARRVQALVELGAMSEQILLRGTGAILGTDSLTEECDRYRQKLRETAILFPRAISDQLLRFLGEIMSAYSAAEGRAATAYPQMISAVEKVQALVRRELGAE